MMLKLILTTALAATASAQSMLQGKHLRGNQFDDEHRELATMMMMPNVTVTAPNMTQDDMNLVQEVAMMALNGTSEMYMKMRKYSFYNSVKGMDNIMFDIFDVNEKMLRNNMTRLALWVAVNDMNMTCMGAFKLYLKFTEMMTSTSMPMLEMSRYGMEIPCPTNDKTGSSYAISSTANASGTGMNNVGTSTSGVGTGTNGTNGVGTSTNGVVTTTNGVGTSTNGNTPTGNTPTGNINGNTPTFNNNGNTPTGTSPTTVINNNNPPAGSPTNNNGNTPTNNNGNTPTNNNGNTPTNNNGNSPTTGNNNGNSPTGSTPTAPAGSPTGTSTTTSNGNGANGMP